MSIEKTYEGMWSSDATLLKSLLDAGETIIAKRKSSEFLVELSICNGKSYVKTLDELNPVKEIKYTNWLFLVPPRPLVLEPKPLEWEKREEVESGIPELDYLQERYENPENWLVATDGVFTYNIYIDGFYEIVGMFCDGYLDTTLHDTLAPHENFDTAKAAIHEWRVNHLKSMLP